MNKKILMAITFSLLAVSCFAQSHKITYPKAAKGNCG